jgi:ABC-type transport system involved in multi-copper enzyme maturation permease subunit
VEACGRAFIPFANPVNPLSEVRLVTQRELRKSFRSVKGGALAALTIVGGTGVSMLFAWLDRRAREELPPGTDFRVLRELTFAKIYGPETAKALAGAPYALWIMLAATLFLAPMLVALLGFDGVAGELQHGTVRFWAVRTRRASYMVGKSLGASLVVLAVTFGMSLIVWGVTAVVGRLDPVYVVGWGLRFFVVSVPIIAAWCGIATLVGSQFRTPMPALLAIWTAFFALWVLNLVSVRPGAEWLSYAYPNSYDRLLLSPRPLDAGKGLVGVGAIAALTTAAAAWLFERRDL